MSSPTILNYSNEKKDFYNKDESRFSADFSVPKNIHLEAVERNKMFLRARSFSKIFDKINFVLPSAFPLSPAIFSRVVERNKMLLIMHPKIIDDETFCNFVLPSAFPLRLAIFSREVEKYKLLLRAWHNYKVSNIMRSFSKIFDKITDDKIFNCNFLNSCNFVFFADFPLNPATFFLSFYYYLLRFKKRKGDKTNRWILGQFKNQMLYLIQRCYKSHLFYHFLYTKASRPLARSIETNPGEEDGNFKDLKKKTTEIISILYQDKNIVKIVPLRLSSFRDIKVVLESSSQYLVDYDNPEKPYLYVFNGRIAQGTHDISLSGKEATHLKLSLKIDTITQLNVELLDDQITKFSINNKNLVVDAGFCKCGPYIFQVYGTKACSTNKKEDSNKIICYNFEEEEQFEVKVTTSFKILARYAVTTCAFEKSGVFYLYVFGGRVQPSTTLIDKNLACSDVLDIVEVYETSWPPKNKSIWSYTFLPRKQLFDLKNASYIPYYGSFAYYNKDTKSIKIMGGKSFQESATDWTFPIYEFDVEKKKFTLFEMVSNKRRKNPFNPTDKDQENKKSTLPVAIADISKNFAFNKKTNSFEFIVPCFDENIIMHYSYNVNSKSCDYQEVELKRHESKFTELKERMEKILRSAVKVSEGNKRKIKEEKEKLEKFTLKMAESKRDSEEQKIDHIQIFKESLETSNHYHVFFSRNRSELIVAIGKASNEKNQKLVHLKFRVALGKSRKLEDIAFEYSPSSICVYRNSVVCYIDNDFKGINRNVYKECKSWIMYADIPSAIKKVKDDEDFGDLVFNKLFLITQDEEICRRCLIVNEESLLLLGGKSYRYKRSKADLHDRILRYELKKFQDMSQTSSQFKDSEVEPLENISGECVGVYDGKNIFVCKRADPEELLIYSNNGIVEENVKMASEAFTNCTVRMNLILFGGKNKILFTLYREDKHLEVKLYDIEEKSFEDRNIKMVPKDSNIQLFYSGFEQIEVNTGASPLSEEILFVIQREDAEKIVEYNLEI